jgi:CheY-like chemotaxis protein
VDDHRAMLARVSAILADDFDVAGLATGGREAIDIASGTDLDAIVLDINMPGLDGFETLRALQQAGSRVPVVFLSTIDADESISEAFRRGGRGYVVKPYLDRDLPCALDQVLLGRRFVPSLTSLFQVSAGSGHAMQLYRDADAFSDGLADFFDLALRRGDAACIIATEDVRDGLGARLRARGWDLGGPSGHPRCLLIEAADALDRFMRDGHPDPERLTEIVEELEQYRRAVAEGSAARLTIFGNMVVALIAQGAPAAAMELEHHWNALTHGLPFFTLCGYASACFHDPASDVWAQACAEHAVVSHANHV